MQYFSDFDDSETPDVEEDTEAIDDNVDTAVFDKYLYEGSLIKLGEFFLMLASHAISFGLCGAAVEHFIKFNQQVLPKPNELSKLGSRGYRVYQRYFEMAGERGIKKWYCRNCGQKFKVEVKECFNCKQQDVTYWVQLRVESQLRRLFKGT